MKDAHYRALCWNNIANLNRPIIKQLLNHLLYVVIFKRLKLLMITTTTTLHLTLYKTPFATAFSGNAMMAHSEIVVVALWLLWLFVYRFFGHLE